MALFKKVACFTDIHFGMKGNSRVHNDDCEAFVHWFIKEAKALCSEYNVLLIADEIQEKVKRGMSETDAGMLVMKKYEAELKKLA